MLYTRQLWRWIAQLFKNMLRFLNFNFVTGQKESVPSLPVAHYVTAAEAFLTVPSGAYSQDSNFVPMIDDVGGILKYVGTHNWDANLIGTGRTYNTASAGAVGLLKFVPIFGAGGSWTTFASGSFDGTQRLYFPKSANHDKAGGYHDFYFKNAAMVYAFSGNGNSAFLPQNGSVYNSATLISANLVVRWDGVTGQAGGGSLISDTPRPI